MSVFWKPLYRLFDDGNPIDPVTILLYDLGPEKRLPFAALAKTRGNRLVLWPPPLCHASPPTIAASCSAVRSSISESPA
jgi:hypothetical protein